MLVVAIAVVGIIGTASADIHSETSIYATYFTSESLLSVSNFPVFESYQSTLLAEFTFPIFPSVDLSYIEKEISGDTFTETNEVVSTPTGSSTIMELSDPSAVEGYMLSYTCVDIGTGEGPKYYELPQLYQDSPATLYWYSSHPEGATYPAYYEESINVYFP